MDEACFPGVSGAAKTLSALRLWPCTPKSKTRPCSKGRGSSQHVQTPTEARSSTQLMRRYPVGMYAWAPSPAAVQARTLSTQRVEIEVETRRFSMYSPFLVLASSSVLRTGHDRLTGSLDNSPAASSCSAPTTRVVNLTSVLLAALPDSSPTFKPTVISCNEGQERSTQRSPSIPKPRQWREARGRPRLRLNMNSDHAVSRRRRLSK